MTERMPPQRPVRASTWPRRDILGGILSGLVSGCRRGAPTSPQAPEPELASSPEDPQATPDPRFVHTRGQQLIRRGVPYAMMGFNYWSAAADSATEAGRARVTRELGRLRELGVTAIRVMAMSEGPDDEPWRVRPAVQPAPGVFTPEGMAGLSWLMEALVEHDMLGVFTLTNFWFWSGGIPQYLAWAGAGPIPYPNPEGGGDWDRFQDFSASFFSNRAARDLFERTIEAVVVPHRDSPAVLAWELCNEPRGRNNAAAYRAWIDDTARFIKRLDPHHLVTTGSEGDTPWPDGNGLDIRQDHQSDAIDLVSFHVWPENWSWMKPEQLETDFDQALGLAMRYIEDQVQKADQLGKPVLLLETGLARDGGSFEPSAATTYRDRYFAAIFERVLTDVQGCGSLAGVFPWSWSGEGIPEQPGRAGQQRQLTGDPPHERQGWYSVYEHDASTTALVAEWAGRMAQASSACGL